MAGAIPAPPPAPKLGWDAQSPLVIPKAGLAIVPGAGLVGRTAGGKMFLDTTAAAVAEFFNLFTPGAVAAGQLGLWRNRRPLGDGTLSVIDAYAKTAPTPDAAPTTNYWRLVATDSAGTAVVLPLSQDAANFHSLDRGAGVALVAPWTGVSGTVPNGLAFAQKFRPTQGMVIGGATLNGSLVLQTTGLPAITAGYRVRAVLTDANGVVLATAYTWITAATQWNFTFDRAQQLTAGTDYFFAWDLGLDVAGQNGGLCDMRMQSATDATMATGTPVRLFGAGGDAVGVIAPGVANNIWCLRRLGLDRAAPANITGAALVAKVIANDGSNWNADIIIQGANASSGRWTLNGTASGLAPIAGDLTWSYGAVGAPAAGSGGSDVNIRAVILP